MWSAIKNDLFEFVNTVKTDTSKVVTKVLGEETDDKEEVSELDRKSCDMRRSFLTYSTPIEEQNRKSFDSFRRSFSLTNKTSDIAQVLDLEPDVSRFYADLVPTNISAEEFWARYFYRLTVLQKGGALNLDEEDDEDIGWENDEETANNETKLDKDDNSTLTPPPSPLLGAIELNIPNSGTLQFDSEFLLARVRLLEKDLEEKTCSLDSALQRIALLEAQALKHALNQRSLEPVEPPTPPSLEDLSAIPIPAIPITSPLSSVTSSSKGASPVVKKKTKALPADKSSATDKPKSVKATKSVSAAASSVPASSDNEQATASSKLDKADKPQLLKSSQPDPAEGRQTTELSEDVEKTNSPAAAAAAGATTTATGAAASTSRAPVDISAGIQAAVGDLSLGDEDKDDENGWETSWS